MINRVIKTTASAASISKQNLSLGSEARFSPSMYGVLAVRQFWSLQTYQIRNCTEWASSSLFSRTIILAPLLRLLFILGKSRNCGKAMSKTRRPEAVNIMVQYCQQQYHLIRIDLSEEQYNHDVAKAINMSYNRYRGSMWRVLSLKSPRKVEYVKAWLSRWSEADLY